MEIDIRKAKEDEEITIIRYGDGDKILSEMDDTSCILSGEIGEVDYIEIEMKDIDNLILALKKYKELYGGNVS